MTIVDQQPLIFWENGQGNIADVWAFFWFETLLTLLSFPQQLKKAGKACVDQKGNPPTLIVVVLPEGGNDIYTAVKKWVVYLSSAYISSHRCLCYGLVSETYRWVRSPFPSSLFLNGAQMGVATQCLKSTKCNRAKIQYWANVMLKCVLCFNDIGLTCNLWNPGLTSN